MAQDPTPSNANMTRTSLETVMVNTDVASILFKTGQKKQTYSELLDSRILLFSFMGVAELYQ